MSPFLYILKQCNNKLCFTIPLECGGVGLPNSTCWWVHHLSTNVLKNCFISTLNRFISTLNRRKLIDKLTLCGGS